MEGKQEQGKKKGGSRKRKEAGRRRKREGRSRKREGREVRYPVFLVFNFNREGIHFTKNRGDIFEQDLIAVS